MISGTLWTLSEHVYDVIPSPLSGTGKVQCGFSATRVKSKIQEHLPCFRFLRRFVLCRCVRRWHYQTQSRVSISRVLSNRSGQRCQARGTETIVGDVEREKGIIGEKHGRDGLTTSSFQHVAREEQPAMI